jgi:hypothetical protein
MVVQLLLLTGIQTLTYVLPYVLILTSLIRQLSSAIIAIILANHVQIQINAIHAQIQVTDL